MYPFYNTNQRLFPFPFFPFPGTGFNRRRRLNRISGIPVLKTTGVTASTTEVRYDVNEEEWRALPNEGLFFLDVILLQLLHKFKQRAPLKKEPKNLYLL